MKIIGKSGSNEFIIVATENEIANICGYDYASGMKPRPDVGQTVSVSALYKALCVSRERKDEIATLADKLRAAAGRVDSINQALAAPIIEVKSEYAR